VTLGDPRGIGPEVMTAAALRLREEDPEVEILFLGAVGDLPAPGGGWSSLAVGSFDGSLLSAGTISLDAIRRGVALALAGQVSAIVTGPVHKPALHAAGSFVPGQTELLAELSGASRVGMLMAAESTRTGRPLRILLATTHVALRDVPALITSDRLEAQIRTLDEGLRVGWGIPSPKITLCALNPHASDGGLFGDEEARVMSPVADRLRDAGIAVVGPLPADTAFLTMVEGEADGIVVPYHDVGMAVFKTLSFGRGVNVTLGLPFPRTSPDHGTAFDLAGMGRADSGSALEALRLGARLARNRARQEL